MKINFESLKESLKKNNPIIFESKKIHRVSTWIAVIIYSLFGCSYGYYLHKKPAFASESTPGFTHSPQVTVAHPSIPENLVTSKDFGLIIPKISAALPVVADVDGSNKDAYAEALQHGIAHFKNTSKPDGHGNIFIFGHSSDWSWNKGDFKTAFARLPEISKGDDIVIWYKEKQYFYRVIQTVVVEPTDISWLEPTSKDYLTLMTCYPIHTDKQRLIVRAEPVL